MASGSHRMPANPHIVGRIEERRIDPRPVARIALMLPIVLGYTALNYFIFRGKVKKSAEYH